MLARTTINLSEAERLSPMPFVSEDGGRAVAWVEIGSYEVGVYGPPDALRELAAVALAAADQAEKLLRIAEQLRPTGIAEREAV